LSRAARRRLRRGQPRALAELRLAPADAWGGPTLDPTRVHRAANKTAATVEVAVLAGRGNRPHPSTPRGRPKRFRAGVFPPTVHESGTARPDELSSLGLGPGRHDRTRSVGKRRAPGCPVGAGSTPPPRQRWWCWRSWGKAAAALNTAATTEVVVMAVLGQGRHPAQHRHSRVGGGVVIPRRGDP